MVSRHFKQYCNGIYCNTGVNCFWIIDNSQQVLSALSKINYFSTAKHLDSYDFSTLYTSSPHTSLKEALTSLIKEAYRVRDNIYLVADIKGKVFWTDIPSKAASKYNITDCAPLLANLFLFYYEYKYMKNLIMNNIILAKKFNNTMRYIDDLLTLNNTQFDAAIQDIYPS